METVNGGKTSEYGKEMKIKFDCYDHLPLNKRLKFPATTKVVRSVFEEHGKYYLEVYLV